MPTKQGVGREPKTNEPSNVTVAVRMRATMRTKAQRAANADGRTINNWILQLIRKELA